MKRVIAAVVAVPLMLMLLMSVLGSAVFAAIFGGGTGDVCLGTVTSTGVPDGLSNEQAANALIIVMVGEAMDVPVHGWVIAIATAIQESNLINLTTATDHDSLGLFQQRPSQGWGTTEQITDPAYAAQKFYEALVRVAGWQTMSVTQAAQAVQKSAYPNAYADHEAQATAIVESYLGATPANCAPVEVSSDGWARPVPGGVTSGFRTTARPNHNGVDLEASRDTIIRASSTGVVVTVLCNVAGKFYTPTGSALPCDSDGYPGLGGCGWYVDIRHTGDIVSRYCHMGHQPAVSVGQAVTAGQAIGLVGNSGNSSGPHLHFEIHTAYPADSGNAIDPVPFMTSRGVAL